MSFQLVKPKSATTIEMINARYSKPNIDIVDQNSQSLWLRLTVAECEAVFFLPSGSDINQVTSGIMFATTLP